MPMKFVSVFASAAASVSVASRKPDGDHHVGVVLEGRVDVLGVVGLGRGLDVVGLEAEAVGRGLHALVGVLVERAVVDLADVGDQADGEAVRRLDASVLRLLAHVVELDLGGVDIGAAVVEPSSVASVVVVVGTGVVIVAACRCEQPEGDQSGREAKRSLVQGSLRVGSGVRPHSSHPVTVPFRQGGRVRFARIRPATGWRVSAGARPDSAPMARILVTEKIADGGLDRLRAAGHEVDLQLDLTPEQLLEAVRGRPRADHPVGHHRHRRRARGRARTSWWSGGPGSGSTTSTPRPPPPRA